MSQHKAASFAKQGEPAQIVEVSTTSPSDGQVLVKAHAVAINPVDGAIKYQGLFVQSWPTIAGSDVAGEVVEVGSGVTNVKKGDRVLVATTVLVTGNKAEAGYQELVIAPSIAVTKIPDSTSYTDAVVVPLSASTAAHGLYSKSLLGLDKPSTSPKSNGKKLLIWGASGSVGASAVQLGVASGYEVITTASKKNFDHAKSLGASKVFDYSSPSIVGDLTEEFQKATFAGAYDAVGKPDTILAIATVIAQLGGGKIATVLPPPEDNIPATVEIGNVFAPVIFVNPEETEVGQAVFQDFLPAALASGQFVPSPKPEVVGTGLGAIDGAIATHAAGVSAKKIVVTL